MAFCKCRIGSIWAAAALVIWLGAPRSTETGVSEQALSVVAPYVPQAPQVEVVEGTIRRNSTLVATLVDLDVPAALAHDLATLVQPVFNLRNIQAGKNVRVAKIPDGTIHAVEYKIDDERILKIEREADSYAAKVETLEMESRYHVVSAEITAERNSLFAALADEERGADIAVELAAIFAWDVDFSSEIQRNDTIKAIVPALYHEGNFVKWGKVQAAELVNSGKTYRGFRFNNEYYDAEGNALKRAFLISPLKFSRISSGFTRRRLHPILGTNRPHLAVDYAAPTGTTVLAVANGTVISAGWNSGGYGNFVQIRHKNGLTTGYAHLSRIASGVRAGRSISQGDVIGAVGRTGLATGPHLHFIMTENGRPINPLSKKSEPPVPIEAGLKPEFFASITGWQAQLNGGDAGLASAAFPYSTPSAPSTRSMISNSILSNANSALPAAARHGLWPAISKNSLR